MRPLFAGLVLLTACAPKPETPEQTNARIAAEVQVAGPIIDSLNREAEAHFNAGHADLFAAGYTEDAEFLMAGQPVANGRPAIAAVVSAMAPLKAALKITRTALVANGPIAVERGSYVLSLVPPGAAAAVTEEGNYLVLWRRIGGAWLRLTDIGNSPNPLPPAK